MYRLVNLCLLGSLILSNLVAAQDKQAIPAHILVAGQQALSRLGSASGWSFTLLANVKTTALGCRLIDGLPLPDTIEVYQLDLTIADEQYRVQVSADGTMTQACDERFPNLSNGLLPSRNLPGSDIDGDTIVNEVDNCPTIAGIFIADLAGCPKPSPADRDGDGSGDSVDYCPRQAGAAATDGCALLQDIDGDGVPDAEDICAFEFGIIRSDFALGCPADGSGSSTKRRTENQICRITGEAIPLYQRSTVATSIIGTVDENSREILGRGTSGDWYQISTGWVSASDIMLRGACYNIPLVQATPGSATGCFLRPRSNTVNVRQAPRGKQVAQIPPNQVNAVLGQNFAGDWLFFRQGWVSLSVLELSGPCDQLPLLDPEKVSSGTVSFCPPDYIGLLPPRIDIGHSNARVASETLANRLRAQPKITAEQIGEIAPRDILDAVLDGPACDGAFVWWQVEAGGQIGWTVESDLNANYYYLEPVAANDNAVTRSTNAEAGPGVPAASAQPTTFQKINSANVARLDTIKVLLVDKPTMLAWSPRDSQLVVLRADGVLEIYAYLAFELLLTSETILENLRPVVIAFSPDGRFLALGTEDGQVYLVGLSGSELVIADGLPGRHDDPVRALAWSRDGTKLASASGSARNPVAGNKHTLNLWHIRGPRDAVELELQLTYAFPYPLTDLAFSDDDRWLAVAGESAAKQRAALWIYDSHSYELAFSKALVYMRGEGKVQASLTAALGDFVYSNGDSLYHIDIESGQDRRFYHLAGAILPQLTIRLQIIRGAEALFALTTTLADGSRQVRLFNALNSNSPTRTLQLDAVSIAFSPDGRALAAAEPKSNRVLVLGVADR